MAEVPKGAIQVFYNEQDITSDISKHLINFSYHDKVEDESDELVIELEDSDALWRNEWYPEKGAKIYAKIGKDKNSLVECGTFELDEIEQTGPPDTVTLRCMATLLAPNLRTKKGSSHEKKTLAQIAKYVADNNGFTIIGTVPNITINRCTQHRETDLHWLRRLSREYGVVFSLRGNQLIFTSIYDLESTASVFSIARNEIIRYKLTDKMTRTYKAAQVKYHDVVNKAVIDTTYHSETLTNADGIKYTQLVKDDVFVVQTKTENDTQAKEKAKAALYRANTKQKTGTIKVPGDPLYCAGNNIDITDMGVGSAKYGITESSHNYNKHDGYTTDLDIKAVATVPVAKNKIRPKHVQKKARTTPPATRNQGGIEIYTDLNVKTFHFSPLIPRE